MTKRLRSDSATSIIKAMEDAHKPPLEVPAHVRLRDCDKPFWDDIITGRPRDEWLKSDFPVIAQLARVQADIEVETQLLEDEGTVLTRPSGMPQANPRVLVLEGMARREMALIRTLRLGGRESGDASKDAARNRTLRQSAAVLQELADDDLLAT